MKAPPPLPGTRAVPWFSMKHLDVVPSPHKARGGAPFPTLAHAPGCVEWAPCACMSDLWRVEGTGWAGYKETPTQACAWVGVCVRVLVGVNHPILPNVPVCLWGHLRRAHPCACGGCAVSGEHSLSVCSSWCPFVRGRLQLGAIAEGVPLCEQVAEHFLRLYHRLGVTCCACLLNACLGNRDKCLKCCNVRHGRPSCVGGDDSPPGILFRTCRTV